MTSWTYPTRWYLFAYQQDARSVVSESDRKRSSYCHTYYRHLFPGKQNSTELQAMMHDGGVDPLLDFSDVCRQELETDLSCLNVS